MIRPSRTQTLVTMRYVSVGSGVRRAYLSPEVPMATHYDQPHSPGHVQLELQHPDSVVQCLLQQ